MVLRSFLLFFAAAVTSGLAQKYDPVQWTLAVEPAAAAPGARVVLKFKATIEPGWHLYSTTTNPHPGPVRSKIALSESAPVALKQLYLFVRREGVVMGFADVFLVLTFLFAALACFTFLMKRPARAGTAPDAH